MGSFWYFSSEEMKKLLGTVVNTLSIIVGSLIGLLFSGTIPEKYSKTIMHAMGLAVVLIGIKTALQTDTILMVIVSLAIGSFLGELARVEDRLDQLGNWIGGRLSQYSQGISSGCVSGERPFRKASDTVRNIPHRWHSLGYICINPGHRRSFFCCLGFCLPGPYYDNGIFCQRFFTP